ncbi:DapH/DapD/GlmU-related protein [Aeromicrobium wangtongii]|uniref:DapH/DapD/GlmU-related protein n=1 Tax=Aeromicrobium wangtongii TaxID=2969247 RepID=UPI002714E85F|nr:DapH/DapD/GlmU-related protein [Aeromicrobium wangtongii]
MISDSDWHPLDRIPRRYAPAPSPVESDTIRIADDVFLGARSIILKGVTIGEGTVVGSGSVVTRSLPPHVVAAGSPARVVRELRV